MRLRVGYELNFEFPQPTPVLSVLNVHFSRVSDLEAPDLIRLDPAVPLYGATATASATGAAASWPRPDASRFAPTP